jgi:hypothetical protein
MLERGSIAHSKYEELRDSVKLPKRPKLSRFSEKNLIEPRKLPDLKNPVKINLLRVRHKCRNFQKPTIP